jgi:hypothetical protein
MSNNKESNITHQRNFNQDNKINYSLSNKEILQKFSFTEFTQRKSQKFSLSQSKSDCLPQSLDKNQLLSNSKDNLSSDLQINIQHVNETKNTNIFV